jgi:integrase
VRKAYQPKTFEGAANSSYVHFLFGLISKYDFPQWARAAGLPDRCRLHGLKKAKMTELAHHGATTHELMGVSGHTTLSEVQRYTDAANQKRLADAAMARLERLENAETCKPAIRLTNL